MGLCKCPKRKVTNQFCFEHRVNVCEHCIVQIHGKCVIQSYLKWLEDSDYSPLCKICQQDLNKEPCVRLTCYHIYHWVCLDKTFRKLPSNTAPAGYTCPTCDDCIFPKNNLVSPVADALREQLNGVNWARAGLGMPLLEPQVEKKPEFSETQREKNQANQANQASKHQNINFDYQRLPSGPRPTPEGENSNVHHYDGNVSSRNKGATTTQVDFSDLSNSPLIKGPDNDENKYKRKSAFEMLHRYLRNISQGRRRISPIQRYFMIALVLFFIFLTFIALMNHFGRNSDYNDPMLEPMNNPNIHVAEN